MGHPDARFLATARDLEQAYLKSTDPIEQSGFSGGRSRWVAERSPLVEGIHRDGDFLDVGCANGLLAHDVVAWARRRGHMLTPHGVDIGARLVELAKRRMPESRSNFHVADAWSWEPDRQWTFVYSLLDLSPGELLCDWLERLMGWVAPGGRLVVGSYGGLTPRIDPMNVGQIMDGCGYSVNGSSWGGDPAVTRFAWVSG